MKWILLLLWSATAAGQTVGQQPQITVGFTRDHVLLGEPVWVTVTAHNGSSSSVRWEPRDPQDSMCFAPRPPRPVMAIVPDAARGGLDSKTCPGEDKQPQAYWGDCQFHMARTSIASGGSETWQVLLEGNFHITHAGAYSVQVTPYGALGDPSPPPVQQTLSLVVLPRNDAALLVREQALAADAEAELRSVPPAVTGPDFQAILAARDEQEVKDYNARQVLKGLAQQPAPGMEQVFERWLNSPIGVSGLYRFDSSEEAVLGLYRLNSKDSRAELAKIAAAPGPWAGAATVDLGMLEDTTYLPLLVRLATAASTDGNVRVSSEALSWTKSRVAVKSLIDLLRPRAGQPLLGREKEDFLFALTHHRLEADSTRTPEQTYAAWLAWWNTTGKNAPVYARCRDL